VGRPYRTVTAAPALDATAETDADSPTVTMEFPGRGVAEPEVKSEDVVYEGNENTGGDEDSALEEKSNDEKWLRVLSR